MSELNSRRFAREAARMLLQEINEACATDSVTLDFANGVARCVLSLSATTAWDVKIIPNKTGGYSAVDQYGASDSDAAMLARMAMRRAIDDVCRECAFRRGVSRRSVLQDEINRAALAEDSAETPQDSLLDQGFVTLTWHLNGFLIDRRNWQPRQ